MLHIQKHHWICRHTILLILEFTHWHHSIIRSQSFSRVSKSEKGYNPITHHHHEPRRPRPTRRLVPIQNAGDYTVGIWLPPPIRYFRAWAYAMREDAKSDPVRLRDIWHARYKYVEHGSFWIFALYRYTFQPMMRTKRGTNKASSAELPYLVRKHSGPPHRLINKFIIASPLMHDYPSINQTLTPAFRSVQPNS